MKKSKTLIAGFIVLIISVPLIFYSNLNVLLFPSQEEQLEGKLEFGALTSDFMIVQEITAKKEYLDGIEILLYSSALSRLTKSTIMFLDRKHNILHSMHFTNENLYQPKYLFFKFPEKIHVGKGEKIILCLLSPKGDKENHLAVPRNPSGEMGTLSVRPVVDGDIMETLRNTSQIFVLEGSLCIRTYESNHSFINWFKIFLLFLAVVITVFIVFFKNIRLFIGQLSFTPEKIFVVMALIFGLLLVFITPPLQVPDEHDHLNRAYQLSEFNIFQYESDVPSSLIHLFDVFGEMNFNSYKKTSVNEILAQNKNELNPQIKTKIKARPFIFPYFPQALGIFIGKQFDLSPLMLLYMGRIFNLLFSIYLIYLSIRVTPVLKWTLFLLGLMPMTLYLCASLSKDAMIIGFAFLLIALFLRFAYVEYGKIKTIEWIGLFSLSFLLTTSRSIYAVLIGLFLLIPVNKIGSVKKYIIIFSILIITVFMATQVDILRPVFKPQDNNTSITASVINSDTLSKQKHYENFQRPDRVNIPQGINITEQKKFIMNNPMQYIGIMFASIKQFWRLYLDSFVGMLGWLNKPLPNWHINFYLIILIVTALLFANKEIEIQFMSKLVAALIFIIGFVFIETGLYLTWNQVANDYIMDVQGRYFIPYAPLFFILFYNTFLAKHLAESKQRLAKNKKRITTKKFVQIIGNNEKTFLLNVFCLLVICFSLVSSLSTLYVVLTGYYIVLI